MIVFARVSDHVVSLERLELLDMVFAANAVVQKQKERKMDGKKIGDRSDCLDCLPGTSPTVGLETGFVGGKKKAACQQRPLPQGCTLVANSNQQPCVLRGRQTGSIALVRGRQRSMPTSYLPNIPRKELPACWEFARPSHTLVGKIKPCFKITPRRRQSWLCSSFCICREPCDRFALWSV